MLHTLSDDPYGIYGLILTPTRELAIQIADQVSILNLFSFALSRQKLGLIYVENSGCETLD